MPNDAAEANPATAHLFIINPLSGQRMDNLFSTHPATENRIAALMELEGRMRWQGDMAALGVSTCPAASAGSAFADDAAGPWGNPADGERRGGPGVEPRPHASDGKGGRPRSA